MGNIQISCDNNRKVFSRVTTENRLAVLTQVPFGTMDLKEVVGRMWAGFVLRETERIWNSCEYGNDLDSSYATGMFFIICLAISWNLRNCFAMWSQNKRILIWVSFFFCCSRD